MAHYRDVVAEALTKERIATITEGRVLTKLAFTRLLNKYKEQIDAIFKDDPKYRFKYVVQVWSKEYIRKSNPEVKSVKAKVGKL